MAGRARALTVRVLLLVDCYLPYPKSQAKLIHDLGVELLRQGHEVAVLAPSEAVASTVEVRMEDGLQVVRVKGPRIKGASKVMRAIHEERLASLLWRGAGRFLRDNRFDLVVYYSPSIFLGRLVARLKRRWGCRSYLVLRDIFPQWAVDAGLLRKGLIWRFFRHRELQQYAAADVIGVQLPHDVEYFRTELPRRRYRLEVLYNWMSLEREELPRADLRGRLGLRDEIVFFYGGNIGVAQDMDNILRLAAAFPAELRAAFVIVGEGSEVERLKAKVGVEWLANVHLLPAVPQGEYLAMLGEVDVGLISLDRRLTTHNLPGKMLGYMHASLPILASLNPGNDLAKIVPEGGAGLCSLNGDDATLLRDAVSLARDPELRRRMGAGSRALLEQRFSAAAAARQIVAAFSGESRR
ncbi:MAG TPA: glycosyltransferase family 4 protein [Polyangiaceae bacterium]